MGGGSSKNKKADKKNSKQVKSLDALEVKDQDQLDKEKDDFAKQKQVKSGEIDSQMNIFIANDEQLENNPKLTSPLKPGGGKTLNLMQIEEQQIVSKDEANKSVQQDSLQVNPSPLKPRQMQDSFSQKEQKQQIMLTPLQQKVSQNNFKTNSAQQLQQQGTKKGEQPQKSKLSQQKRDELSFDISREMGAFDENKQKQPDFNCDLSAIYSDDEKETPQQQAQRIFKRIQQVAEINQTQNMNDKMRFFNWPGSGECKIMSVTFKLAYSHKDQDLKMIKSYDYHTASTLQWQKNPQLNTYDFMIQDHEIFDAHNASTTHLQNNFISFVVGEKGEFICIKDEQTFVNNVRKNQTVINSRANASNTDQTNVRQRRTRESIVNKQKIEKDKVITETESQMKQMWQQSITEFLEKDFQNKENKRSKKGAGDNKQQNDDEDEDEKQKPYQAKKEIINYNLVHNGYNCQVIQKVDIQPREKIENFLKDNLTKNEKYYNMCFKNPKKTIRDKLKQWDIVNEQDEHELMPKKFRFPVLRKHEVTQGIMEDKNQFMRPHTITSDVCKMVVIDHRRDLFVDVGQELKLLVFLWPERGDNQNQIHFYEELSKFKDMCDNALKSMVLDLSRVRALPLSYRPKLKKKYFELY